MRQPADYVSLVESYAATTAILSTLSKEDAEDASREILALALRLLARDAATDERLEKIAVWHADRFYRLVHQLDVLDASSFLFLRSVGGAFEAVMKERRLSIAYLADNQIPGDRFAGLNAAFSSLGFVVASPEMFIEPLLEATPGAAPAGVHDEAVALAFRLYDEALAEARNVLWTSADLPLDGFQWLAGKLRGKRYVGVFRNDAPADGTEVQIFQNGGGSKRLG